MFGRFRKTTHDADAAGPSAEEVLAPISKLDDLSFQVVGPEDGACVCNDWVGAVLSIDGRDNEHPSLSDAVADGLFHVGCRHTLRPYAVAGAGSEDRAQAEFRTRLALDIMTKRANAGEPDNEERFTRLYGWARRADSAGGHAAAVVLCEAALELLHAGVVFGASQDDLERILRARIATIRSRTKE